jgi:DNA-nicking Smr family endonuclease
MRGKRREPGGLASEDRVLWDEVKKSIKPLRKRAPAREAAETPAAKPPAAKPAKLAVSPSPGMPAARAEPPKSAPLANLDRRTRNRVARGRIEIDARLDLHGYTLERAVIRLERFLASSQAEGASLALVITGKSGALRREVPQWLAGADLRRFVIGFEEAAPHHGGSGALYVRVRRPRA